MLSTCRTFLRFRMHFTCFLIPIIFTRIRFSMVVTIGHFAIKFHGSLTVCMNVYFFVSHIFPLKFQVFWIELRHFIKSCNWKCYDLEIQGIEINKSNRCWNFRLLINITEPKHWWCLIISWNRNWFFLTLQKKFGRLNFFNPVWSPGNGTKRHMTRMEDWKRKHPYQRS